MSPPIPTVRCQVTDRCAHHAYVRIRIGGVLAAQGPWVVCCRTHHRLILDRYLRISNDIRIGRAT